MDKKLIIAITTVVILGLAAGLFAFAGSDNEQPQQNDTQRTELVEQTDDAEDRNAADSSTPESAGILATYSQQALASSEAETNLIFFHAAWCSVCNSVERALMAGTIPEGMAIFQVDYDSDEGQALAEKYNIPIQYSVVQVDTAGNEITQWVNNYNDGADEFQQRIET